MGIFYSSLRLKAEAHRLRFSNISKKVEAAGPQTIEFRAEPYPHFQVMPGGIEIPMENVASAIPTSAPLADKLKRTTGARVKKDG